MPKKLALLFKGKIFALQEASINPYHCLFQLQGCRVQDILITDQEITIHLASYRKTARCPTCQKVSHRTYGSYPRCAAEVPHADTPVTVQVQVARFVCANSECRRKTFAAPLPDLPAFARHTQRMNQKIEAFGFSLGGRAGARLAARTGMSVGRSTVLRRLHAAPTPTMPTPRVLAVDDFALRRGHRYGTILHDLESGRPIELLPDRCSASFARWLVEHPGVEVISRDRGGCYAEGARMGAPHAVQFADRFHLLQNLSDALRRFFIRVDCPLREAARAQAAQLALGASNDDDPLPQQKQRQTPSRDEQEREARRDRRVARYKQVRDLHAQGLSSRVIARQVGLSRVTVARYLQAEGFPEISPRQTRAGALAPYTALISEHCQAGCSNAVQVFQQVQSRGYRGSYSAIVRYLHRTGLATGRNLDNTDRARATAAGKAKEFYTSAREAASLFYRKEEKLKDEDKKKLEWLYSVRSDCRSAYELVQRFGAMVRERAPGRLDTWMQDATAFPIPELKGFAEGLKRDLDAVRAGITGPWSNGPLEGQINRVKYLKRQMYGRASFHLLRQRVLHPN